MAKKSTKATGTTSRPSRLLMEISEAKAKLEERIKIGTELKRRPINSQDSLDAIRRQYSTWDDYNETLLRRMFDTEEERDNYKSGYSWGLYSRTLSEYIRDLHKDFDYRIGALESIVARLELYEVTTNEVVPSSSPQEVPKIRGGNQVFIVHGRDDALKEAAARLVSNLGLEPIILHEQVNRGRTIMQKLMDHADQVVFAVILMTADDVGRLATSDDQLQPRARQNVVFEHGYFLGVLGSDKVCALYAGVELPSDLAGVVYVSIDNEGAWKYRLAREMKASGINIDMNQVV